jgi:hypothetical protein
MARTLSMLFPATLTFAALFVPTGAMGAPPAQDKVLIVVMNETGGALSDVELATIVNGQKQPRGATGADGTLSFDVNILNVGKGTPVRVVVIRCGEQVEVQLVPPNEKERCEDEKDPQKKCECREGGIIPWGSGRLVVRVTKTGATSTFTPDEPRLDGPGPRVEVTLLGAWQRSRYSNIDAAEATIADRYRASGYTEFSTRVNQSDNGFGGGAAIRFMFGRIGLLGGYSYQNLGTGEVHTSGTRVLNNLAFRLDSAFDVKAHKVIVGVPIGSSRFVVIPYYGRAFWDVDRTIVDELRAGGVRVRGGTASDAADGSDNLFGARLEAYLHRLFGGFVEVERIAFKNVFTADGPDALPPNPDNTNVIVGIVIRVPIRR